MDFDALNASSAQTLPLMTFTEDGYPFELSFTRTNDVAISGPAFFDSANPVKGGTDLSPVAQGNDGISGVS